MPEYLRVRDKDTKHEFTVVESSFDKDSMTSLKSEDAVDVCGDPLPPKFADQASTAGQSAATKKES